MSQFSTGDLAKAVGVSVRTVQYYDQRGILVPAELTEGGRRSYGQKELERLQTICFLRDLDFSLAQIKKLLDEENIDQVLGLLLEDQVVKLEAEERAIRDKLTRTHDLQKQVAKRSQLSVESLSDISRFMETKLQWRRFLLKKLGLALGLTVIYVLMLWLLDMSSLSWLMFFLTPLYVLLVFLLTNRIRKQMNYLCPNCHQTFEPDFLPFSLAGHTPRTRKLKCPHCQVKSYCLVLVKEKEASSN